MASTPGIDKVLAELTALKDRQRNLRDALYQEALEIEGVARSRTPVETGALRASFKTTVSEEGDKIVARIEVGGPAAPYAMAVHENMEIVHPGPHWDKETHTRDRYCDGQAKFLESAVDEATPGLWERVLRRAGYV